MEIIQGNNNILSELIALANRVRDNLNKGEKPGDIENNLKESGEYNNVTIISVVEKANITFNAKTQNGPNVGDVNSHRDSLIDPEGNNIGTMIGSGWKIATLADDSVVSWYHETAETLRGNIEISGVWNSSAIWAGEWQSLFAAGVSGEVMGKIGVRQIFQAIPREKYLTLIVLLPIDQIKSFSIN
ncbi:allene oxide cyclase barrel-like domain-containing protein [Rouxiella sp. Mn2063]|uniref:allene oxide cyclase barrel-like domain-containing protein n=1 Tax=Rouxiella sp. Mn2063 TaxID=3395262 RepID=UPI003BE6FC16